MSSTAPSDPGRFESVVREQVLQSLNAGYANQQDEDTDVSPEDQENEILRALVTDFLLPAIDAATDLSTFFAFWDRERVADFRSLRRALRIVRKPELRPRLTPSRTLELFSNVAFEFGGEQAETALRRARADLAAAGLITRGFKLIDDSDRAALDGETAAKYWFGQAVAMGALYCLPFALDASASQKKVLISALRAAASIKLEAAFEAAKLRDLIVAFPADALAAGWTEPSGSMFKYLALRAPEILAEKVQDVTLNVGLRARAVEAVAKLSDSDAARRILLPLVTAGPVAIREAAIVAIQHHSDEDTFAVLRHLAEDRSQPDAVRESAQEAVDAN